MKKNIVLFLIVLFPFIHLTAIAQSVNPPQSLPHSQGSAATNATGHDYFGFDLGITGSAYVGNQNFFWPVTIYYFNNAPTILPFDNFGNGAGALAGVKAGFPLSSTLDLEGKLRYHTNYTTHEETHNLPAAIAYNLFGTTPQGTGNYSLLLNYLDFDALLHLAFGDRWYGIGGLGFSSLLSNTFSGNQTLAMDTYYTTAGNPSSVTIAPQSISNFFTSSRFDLQLGAGSVFPLGLGGTMLDAEFLLSIPFTEWMQSGLQHSIDSLANFYSLSAVSFPKLWYASLTIGIRFPFGNNSETKNTIEVSNPLPASSNAGIASDSKVVLTGRVTNAKTGEPIDANMTVVDLTNNEVVATDRTDRNGQYNVRVKAPGKYSVTADADGYLFGTSYFEVDPEGRILARHPDIQLSEASGGKTRLLLFFDFNKSDLNQASYPELDRAVRLMKAVPSMEVEIVGYTDNVGSADYNKSLSQKRANAVRDYLIAHGIPKARVAAKGYGMEDPIADNSTDEGRSENRRVEFVVMSK
ncbi:MAG TPA: OmpA family protein [Candidatus Kapabacteria bacterium]|jgi:outer membrane protein OmpA-like peptidoglycan-associated protein|nr:OmpA family protein [Candidatus Kapabacteria bacterium]